MRRIFQTALIFLAALAAVPSAAQSPDEVATADAGVDPSMVQSLDEAMKKLAQKRNADGLAMIEKSDFAAAHALFQDAFELIPTSAEYAGNLGYAYYRLGNLKDAEQILREALALDPERFATYLNLAEVLVREGETLSRLEEAERLLIRAGELKEDNSRVTVLLARAAALSGKFAEAKRHWDKYLEMREANSRTLLEVGDFYRSFGRSDQALVYYRKIKSDDKFADEAAARIRGIEIANMAGQYQWSRSQDAPPPEAKLLTAKAKILAKQKKWSDAEELLLKALSLAPGHTEARLTLGDLYWKTARGSQAELAYLRALALDSGNAEILERLGKLYLEAPGKQGPREAALILSRALILRPDWLDLHLVLAKALQLSGDLKGALANVDQFIAEASAASKGMSEALELKQSIEQLIPKATAEKIKPAAKPEKKSKDKNLAKTLTLARRHLARGEPDEALARLRSLPAKMKDPEVLNLEGHILYVSKRLDEAAEVMRKSLEVDGNQAEIHERLGLLLCEQGKPRQGRKHLAAAENLGSDNASFYLARMDLETKEEGARLILDDAGRLHALMKARQRLRSFLGRGRASVLDSEAGTLEQAVSRRIRNVAAAASGLAALVILIIVIVTTRIFGGKRLADLLERYPQSAPDVQRALSAIRHEVLKHNTMMLSGLVRTIEQGESADGEAGFLPESLVRSGKGSAPEKLDEYVDELEKIGRSYGVRLNLKRRDPGISALENGFAELKKIAPLLKKGASKLGRGQRRSVLAGLKKAVHYLNITGNDELKKLLGKLRVLEVDEPLLRSIWGRIRTEPSFATTELAPLKTKLDARSFPIIIPRQAFEDILGNLLRNAIQSSIEDGATPVEIEIKVDNEVETVTGIEKISFQVRDRSSKALGVEMLRGRLVERGLGLTAELVTRYDGSLDVSPGEDGWSKAVVVKLPRAAAGTGEEMS